MYSHYIVFEGETSLADHCFGWTELIDTCKRSLNPFFTGKVHCSIMCVLQEQAQCFCSGFQCNGKWETSSPFNFDLSCSHFLQRRGDWLVSCESKKPRRVWTVLLFPVRSHCIFRSLLKKQANPFWMHSSQQPAFCMWRIVSLKHKSRWSQAWISVRKAVILGGLPFGYTKLNPYLQ